MTEPVAERAVALDALRGIALFGVLIVNLVTIFRVSLFAQFMAGAQARGAFVPALDHAVGRAITLGLEFKAVTLFSLMFGIGLAAQRERLVARGIAFEPFGARRLALLFAIGAFHMFVVWNGDILMLYAITGAATLPLLRLPTRALFALALVFFVVQVLPLPWPSPFPSYPAMAEHVSRASHVYPYGSFTQVLAFRIHEVRPMTVLLLWFVPRTFALNLLGACVWRWGLFRGERRGLVRFMALFGIAVGGAAMWATNGGTDLRAWRDVVGGWGADLLAFGYGAAVLVGFDRPRIARLLALLAPLGRMALTNYLTQSIVLGAIFYGYGLGLFGRLGEARAAAIGVVLYLAQAILSTLWLRRFRFGPVEWLWRSVTYRNRQPMLR